MIDRTQLGLRIREARQRSGLSQLQLAEAMGISDKTVSAYEVGRVDPPLEALDKISQATSHPVAYFVGDVQSNIESRLDRIATELEEIRDMVKSTATSTIASSSSPAPSASAPIATAPTSVTEQKVTQVPSPAQAPGSSEPSAL